MKAIRTLLLLVLVAGLSLSVFERSYAKVYASYVRVTQEGSTAPFDGSFADRTGAVIRFFLNHAADSVIINVVPAGGGPTVKTLRKLNLAAGDNAMSWNGSTNSNTPAPTGSYKFEITAYHRGFAAYTEYHLSTPAIFTRGVGSVNNPALKWFGFIYTASNGGYLTGVGRHASYGRQWGNVPDSAKLTTTGVPVGPSELRYATTVDQDGYVYIIGRTARRIYRYHLDTLNVALFDSSAFGTRIQGLDVRGTGASKVLYVAGDTAIFRIPVGTQSFNTVPPTPIAYAAATVNGRIMNFWDVKVGQDSSLYVDYRVDSAAVRYERGIYKWNLATGSLPKTIADTVWTSRIPDGDPVTLALWDGATTSASDDILYMNTDLAAPNTFLSAIYAYTTLGTSSPTRSVAWLDPDNNCSTTRSALATDALGNIIYFENSNEQVVLVSPPSGANSYTYTSFDATTVTTAGVAPILLSISEARVDADGNRRPDRLGDTVKVIGIVNSVNVQTTNFNYFIQDATDGIAIFQFGLTGAPALRPGDRVSVIGAIGYNRGTTQIQPANLATDIAVLDTGNVITSVPLTITQYMASPEQYESRRIQLAVAQPFNFTSTQWPAAGSSANLTIWNGQDTTIMRIDSDTEIDGSTYPVFPVRLTGVGTQFTSATTVDTNGYQITPMFIADFVPINTPPLASFRLLTPANGSSIVIDTTASYNFTWRKAVDFNNDALIYQFKPLAFSASSSNNSGADTVKTLTGTQLRTYLGTGDQLVFRWTVAAKDPPNAPVTSVDTFSVTLYRSFIPPAAGWTSQTSGSVNSLRSVKTISPQLAWISGSSGTVLRTTDGGTTWASRGGAFGTANVNSITAVDSNLALCSMTPSTVSYILRTTNGGARWDTVYSQTDGYIDAIHMLDASNGIALGDPVGGKWTIVRTSNGGATWARIATEPLQVGTEFGYSNAFFVLNNNYMWFGTDNSRIYRTTNGGATWTFGATTAVDCSELWFSDTQNGVAGFFGDGVNRTTNGGATWTAVTFPGTGTIYGVSGAGTNVWIPRGGAVYRSNDLGATWASDYTSTIGTTLRHIDLIPLGNTTLGWVSSSTGGIARFYGTLTGVGEPVFSGIPETFELSQNYPNPFNPSTTIRYALPKDAFVSLKVYNILGQEIATLLNDFQNVGTFNVTWNSRNNAGNQVASGMYLYRMQAKPADGSEPFTSLKKMILLK